MRFNNQDLLDIENQMLGCEFCGGITIREYQLEILEILKEIKRICTKHDIPYFIMFGSLIGAVRHHGFVPWDDDADISMTRENFNKFVDICEDELDEKYSLEYYKNNTNIGLLFPRIRKKNSTYINRFEISKHGQYAGFYVDIIILDYLSEKPFWAKVQKQSLQALHRVVSPGFSQGYDSLSPFFSGMVTLVKSIIGKRAIISLLEKVMGSVKNEETNSVMGQLMLPGRLDFCVYDKSHFEKCWMIPFEGEEFPIPQKALTMLNRSYCKKFFRDGTLLEANYEDEYQAILKREYYRYDDIMYIPPNRKRNTHLDIIFDSRVESITYDSYYFSKFDRKKNDRSAIKERKHREKAIKYLHVLDANEELSKLACEEIRLREVLENYKEQDGISAKLCTDYAKVLNNLSITRHPEISGENLQLAVEIFIKASYFVSAKRLMGAMRKQKNIGNEAAFAKLEESLAIHLEAYYAIFEKRIAYMEEYIKKYSVEDCFFVQLIKAILFYEKEDYETAKELFNYILSVSEETFLAYYYLGEIAEKENKKEQAIILYKKSLDSTLYMPLLEMSLNKIKQLEPQ